MTNTWSDANGFFSVCPSVVHTLPAGMYTIARNFKDEWALCPKEIVSSEFLELPDTPQQYVFQLLKTFINKREVYKQYNLVHKRGILLFGPPGSGKTSIIQQSAKQIVDIGGIVLFGVAPHVVAHMLNQIRSIEKDRLIVVILEEIESLVNDYGEHDFLSMLDGETQIDNVVFLATSNFPELLSKRLTNRPSRFDELIPVDMPTRRCRKAYIKFKYPTISEHEVDSWVEQTDNMSLAHIQELVIAVKCLDKDPQETLNRLRALESDQGSISSEGFKKSSFGFVPQTRRTSLFVEDSTCTPVSGAERPVTGRY